jgi:hypothetical protein
MLGPFHSYGQPNWGCKKRQFTRRGLVDTPDGPIRHTTYLQ